MKQSTLCFCLKNGQVLLAMKKRGFGVGKWNGYGGKVQENETPRVAMVRELEEESTLVVDDQGLRQVGLICFYFEETPVFSCSVYLAERWQGQPVETEEMRPQWYPINNLPFTEMWVADAKWIPLILDGKKIEAEVAFNADGTEVKRFSYKTTTFD